MSSRYFTDAPFKLVTNWGMRTFIALVMCFLVIQGQAAPSGQKPWKWMIRSVTGSDGSFAMIYSTDKKGKVIMKDRLKKGDTLSEGEAFIVKGNAILRLEGSTFEYKVYNGQNNEIHNAPFRGVGSIYPPGRIGGSKGNRCFPALNYIIERSGIPVIQLDVRKVTGMNLSHIWESLKPYVVPGIGPDSYKLSRIDATSTLRLTRPDGSVVRLVTKPTIVDDILGVSADDYRQPSGSVACEDLESTLRVEVFYNFLYAVSNANDIGINDVSIRLVPVTIKTSGKVVSFLNGVEYKPQTGPIEWKAADPFMVEATNRFGKSMNAVLFCVPLTDRNNNYELLWPSLDINNDMMNIPASKKPLILGKDTFKIWDGESGVFDLRGYHGDVLVKLIGWETGIERSKAGTQGASKWSTAEVLLRVSE